MYVWPNSPGANESVEQKPSEELMINVNPSADLLCVRKQYVGIKYRNSTYQVKSVKVAKCKLLTIHSGVCCCVSYTKTAS